MNEKIKKINQKFGVNLENNTQTNRSAYVSNGATSTNRKLNEINARFGVGNSENNSANPIVQKSYVTPTLSTGYSPSKVSQYTYQPTTDTRTSADIEKEIQKQKSIIANNNLASAKKGFYKTRIANETASAQAASTLDNLYKLRDQKKTEELFTEIDSIDPNELKKLAVEGANKSNNPVTKAKKELESKKYTDIAIGLSNFTTPNPLLNMAYEDLVNRYKQYENMTDDQKIIYNALFAKDSKKAEDYFEFIKNNTDLNTKVAQQNLTEEKPIIPNAYNTKTGKALTSGLKGSLAGIHGQYDLLTGDTNKKADRVEAIEAGINRQTAADKGTIAGTVEAAWLDMMQSTGNMLPGIALSAATGNPFLGDTLFALSQGGNAYREAINKGANVSNAQAYAAQQFADEQATNWLLGGIGSLGGGAWKSIMADTKLGKKLVGAMDKVAKTEIGREKLGKVMAYLADAGGEAAQEYLQYFTEALGKEMFLGEKADVKWNDEEAIYSAILGALNSGLLNISKPVISAANATRTDDLKLGYADALSNNQADYANEEVLGKATRLKGISEELQSKIDNNEKVKLTDRMAYDSARNAFTDARLNAIMNGEISDTEFNYGVDTLAQGFGEEGKKLFKEEASKYRQTPGDVYQLQRDFANQYNESFKEASGGTADNNYVPKLMTAEQIAKAKESAKSDWGRDAEETQRRIENLQTALDETAKAGEKNGVVDRSDIDYGKLDGNTKAALAIAENIVTKRLGMNLKLIEEKTDENGKYQGINGSYHPDTNTLTLDIHAGAKYAGDEARYNVILSHEITHWMEMYSPKAYSEIQNMLFANNQNMSQQIQEEIERLKNSNSGEKATRANAISEIVARSCEDMLSNSTTAKKMMNGLDAKTKKEISSHINELGKDINEFFEEMLHKYESTSAEAVALKKEQKLFNSILKKWDSALSSGATNSKRVSGYKLKKAEDYNNKNREYNEFFNRENEPINKREDVVKEHEEMVGSLTEKDMADLEKKGMTVQDGVVVSEENAKKMESEGYEKPSDNTLYSFKSEPDWEKSVKAKFGDTEETRRYINAVKSFTDRMVASDAVREYVPMGSYLYSNAIGSPNNPLRENVEYIITFDMDTSCPRTFQFLRYRDALQKIAGRPLTYNESINLLELMRAYGQAIPCSYCYVENKRVLLAASYNNFFKYRNDVLNESDPEVAKTKMYGWDDKKKKLTDASEEVFEKWKKNPEYNPSIEEVWTASSTARNSVLNYLDKMYDASIIGKSSQASIENIVNEHFDITDKNAKAEISNFVSDWIYDTYAEKNHIYDTENNTDVSEVDEKALALNHEALGYAKSSSSAKTVSQYAPYTDQLNNVPDEVKEYIIGMGGIRKHSSNDFRIDYVQDYFMFFADLALNGWTGHTYTKSTDYAKIFGRTGDRINMSVAFYGNKAGQIRPNLAEGADPNDVKALRKAYKDIGSMAMVTSDAQLSYALNEDWVDMIIPFHSSSLDKRVWYDLRSWFDYTAKQLERFYNSDDMKLALVQKALDDAGIKYSSAEMEKELIKAAEKRGGGVDSKEAGKIMKKEIGRLAKIASENGVKFNKDMKAAETEKAYDEAFKVKKVYQIEGNEKGKRIKPHFLPGDTVVGGVTIPGHHNDVELYKKLCKEYGVHPRFDGVAVQNANGETINVLDHDGYLKLIKETARTDSEQRKIEFNLDQYDDYLGMTPMEYAMKRLEDFAGVDGYSNYSEDSFGIVDEFNKEYLGKNREIGYLTDRAKETRDILMEDQHKADVPNGLPTYKRESNVLNSTRDSYTKETEKQLATLVTFFSGAGTVDAKIKDNLGEYVKQIATVEWNDKISKAYALNESGDVIGLGQSVDVRDFIKNHKFKPGEIFAFHASPSCCDFSNLKNGIDIDYSVDETTAIATADFINMAQPKVFTLENVSGYLGSQSFRHITKALAENGYRYRIGVYQASHFGAAANRRRMFLVATKGGIITPTTPFLTESKGWYEKVKDQIKDLKEVELSPQYKELLTKQGIDIDNPGDYIFVDGKVQFGHLTTAKSDKPTPTIVASSTQYRILTPEGKCLKVTPNIIRSLMGLSDDFRLPADEKTAFRVLGNGVSGELTSSIITPMIAQNRINDSNIDKSYSEINRVYVDAVNIGDTQTATDLFNMYVLNMAGADVTPFLAVNSYYRGNHRNIAKLLKSGDASAIKEAATEMARLVPENAVLVPIPSHYGDARDTLVLARAIGRITKTPVVDALKGVERKSQYLAKKGGRPLTSEEIGIYQQKNIPEDKIPIFIDNVVSSGTTASAAVMAVGRGVCLAYSYASNSKNVANLKSAEPITFDDFGNVIPLSERFNNKNDDPRYSERDVKYTGDYVEKMKEHYMSRIENEKLKKYYALDKQKEKYDAKIKDRVETERLKKAYALEGQKEKYEDKILRLKADKREQLEAQREYFRNREKEEREARKYTSLVNTALRKAKRLEKMKGGAEFESAKEEILRGLSTKTPVLTDKKILELDNLRDEVLAQNAIDENYAKYDGAAALEKIGDINNRHLRDLSAEDITDLIHRISELTKAKQTYDREIKKENARLFSDMGKVFMDQQSKVSGMGEKSGFDYSKNEYLLKMLNPTRAMRMLDGYDRQGILTYLGNELNDGQTRQNWFKMKVGKDFQQIDNNQKLLKDFSTPNITIETADGTAKISKGMRMALFMHSLNEDNMRHIAYGGLRVPDADFYAKEKFADAYAKGKVIQLATEEEKDKGIAETAALRRMSKMFAQMSGEEQEYCRIAWDFFNKTTKEAINEVSNQLKGYDIATTENYFPIKVDSNFLKADLTAMLNGQASIEGMGMLKDRRKDAKPIMLEDISKVVNRQKENTALYYGLAIPVRNFNSFLNFTSKGYKDSVRNTLSNTWGSEGLAYVEDMLKDIQTMGGRKSTKLDKLKSVYAGTVLNLNLGVAIKQSASYPFAASVIGWKPLGKALGKTFTKADHDYMDSITPWGYMRRQGFSGTEMGEVAKQRSGIESNQAFQKLKTSLDWIRRVDVKTTDVLFFATEEWVKEHHPDLEVRGEEYNKILADKYNEVLQRTQPSYDVMQRNAYLRSNDAITKVFGMFKTQTFNMGGELIDAVQEYKIISERAKTDSSYVKQQKEAAKHLRTTIGATIASQSMLAVLTAVANAVMHKMKPYRDDNEEVTKESILNKVMEDFATSFAGLFLYGSEVQKAVIALGKAVATGEKYDPFNDLSYPGLEMWNNLNETITDTVAVLSDAIRDGDKADADKVAKNVAKSLINVTKMCGIPSENIYNLANAVYLWGVDIINDELGTFNAGKGLLGVKDTSVSKQGYAKQMLKQYSLGKPEEAKERVRWANNAGYETDKLADSARDLMKKDQGLAEKVYSNGNDEIKKLATHSMYLATKPEKEDGTSLTKEEKLNTINDLDVSDLYKGEEFDELFDSKALDQWVKDGGSKYDYLQGQQISVDIDKQDPDNVYAFVDGRNYTLKQKSAWLHSDLGRVESEKYKVWTGSDSDYIKHMAKLTSFSGDDKQKDVIAYIKTQPESIWKELWIMAGYKETTFDEKMGNGLKKAGLSSSGSGLKKAGENLKSAGSSNEAPKYLKKY